jgi:hypothetical protein
MAGEHTGCASPCANLRGGAAGHAGAPNAPLSRAETSPFQRRTRGADDAAMSVEEEGGPPPSALLGDDVELPRPLPALMRRAARRRGEGATPAPGSGDPAAGTAAQPGAEPDGPRAQGQRRAHTEAFWLAYVVFFFAGLPLLFAEGAGAFVGMTLAGCATGVVWQFTPRRRGAAATSAMAVYALVLIVPDAAALSASVGSVAAYALGMLLTGALAAAAAPVTRQPGAKEHAADGERARESEKESSPRRP